MKSLTADLTPKYKYPVYAKDSGNFIGYFDRDEIKTIGFKQDHYVIYFN